MSSISGISSTPSAVQSAQLGISRGISSVDSDAQAVAGGADPIAPLIDASQQKLNIEANVKVLQIANETLGSIINLLA
jgi:hypothetical protein